MCAVDDSRSGLQVVMTGRWLAETLDADLTVVHAASVRAAESQLVPMAIRAWLHDAADNVHLLDGSAGAAILEAAEEEGATLLVVGARGRGRARAALLGSVSREVAAGAACPVVIVPPLASDTELVPPAHAGDRYVVCGVDGSDISMATAAFAGSLARSLGCRPVVVHARQTVRAVLAYRGPSLATPPLTGQHDSVTGQVEEMIGRAAEIAGDAAIEIVEPGPPVAVLKDVSERYNAELIFIASGGRRTLGSAVLGSVAAELPVTAGRPVIVVPRRLAERWATGHASPNVGAL